MGVDVGREREAGVGVWVSVYECSIRGLCASVISVCVCVQQHTASDEVDESGLQLSHVSPDA